MMARRDCSRGEVGSREPTTTLRVLLVDDHPVYRHGMRTLLSTLPDLEVVGEADSGEEALALAEQLGPDMAIMDLQLPGMNGIEATRRIKQQCPHVGILVMTMFQDDHCVYGAIRAGAQGYVLKDADEEEMLRAVRAVGHGEAIFSPDTAPKLLRHLIEAIPSVHGEPAYRLPETLSPATMAPGHTPENVVSGEPGRRERRTEDHNSQQFGHLLRRCRRTLGVTQEELAERAGLSPRTISDLERGIYLRPHRDTVRLLAKALELAPEEGTAFVAAARGGEGASVAVEGDRPEERAERPAPSIQTFLVADIRGYTRFTQERGDEAAAQLTLRFAQLTEEVVTSWEGRVVETRGDEVLVGFSSARGALRAAVALQAQLASARAADPSLTLEVGMGLDAGEAIPVRDGYRGGSLNLAARLCSIAGPGEVFCSDVVIHLARTVKGIAAVDRGEVALKGLSAPVRVIQVASEGTVSDGVPPLPPIAGARPANPPDEPTPLTRRRDEIAPVTDLPGQARVRPLTPAGTVGSELARPGRQVSGALPDSFRDAALLVALAAQPAP